MTALARTFTILLSAALTALTSTAAEPPFTDYCERLEHEVQGRKHGFLAGNLTYYIGGYHSSWQLIEQETIGLTHPFYHDLRSRGAGQVESMASGPENTGVGNDYLSWEFYKDTRVLYGSVVINGKKYPTPVPKSMLWRPDRMICEYEVGGVTIREEKFIGKNDAAASIITASQPVILQFAGKSFFTRNCVESTAKIRIDRPTNAIVISEGGTAKSKADPNGGPRVGPSVYDGMTTALSASRDITQTIVFDTDEQQVQHYTFLVPCDTEGTVVTWAMADDEATALAAGQDILKNARPWLAEKTTEMNQLLNEQVPYFRCSDEKFVDIYYYLWALHIMYYIDVQKGWEMEPHTQTAVNNFLGIHRYDAAFQIKVGAWMADKSHYAYGNVLTWKHLTQAGRWRQVGNGIRMLSDNKGISWHSGAYGNETSEHVLGAWQIYQHTGDVEFLRDCYDGHFRKLFEHALPSFWMNEFDVAATLSKMAALIGEENDVEHWQKKVRQDPDFIRLMFDQRWQKHEVENYFAAPEDGMLMTTAFWAMRSSHFPKEYAQAMVENWALDKEKGFYGEWFPTAMALQSFEEFSTQDDNAFGYTPDTAYFTLDGMFSQDIRDTASELTINHLENYNYHDEWDVPVAPEAYRRDLSLFGDQYSNFNAGKILLYLEGLAGLEYSLPDQQLTVRPAMPETWDWMEVRLPIDGQWTSIRYDAGKAPVVTGSPLEVVIE